MLGTGLTQGQRIEVHVLLSILSIVLQVLEIFTSFDDNSAENSAFVLGFSPLRGLVFLRQRGVDA
jgi:hypothetical protein